MTTAGIARWAVRAAALLLFTATFGFAAETPSLSGRWDATVTANGVEVPFPFEIVQDGSTVKGSFFNGELRITSTAGRFENGSLELSFDQYGSTLIATFQDDQLAGEYRRATRAPFPFKAKRASAASSTAADAPSIAGTWIVQAKSNKGESAWRFLVEQNGGNVTATILRVDGDTGTLTGSYQNGLFVLSHFSGARPLRLEVKPAADGTLTLKQNNDPELVAARPETARAKEIGVPTDPGEHTRMKDPSEPFRFSFPDLQGQIVSNTDEKFRGKVLLVNISGSWCPNCHDEAPFLASLYRKYQPQGFEVVTLSFEEATQQPALKRLHAFIANYGIGYTVLVAGEPEQLKEKVPQAEGLDAFPTSFLIGRDGRVREVHAGFPSPGSGEFYKQAEQDVTTEVERLLAEGATTSK
jgi:peroxiredoxin